MKEQLIILINQVPYAKVVSYGALATQLDIQYGTHTSGWMVGRILSSAPRRDRKYEPSCPRWRVINKQWVVSTLKLGEKGLTQVDLLREEGIKVVDGRVDMEVYEYDF